ncbi:hypothetical protein ACQJBY_018046 [Aegilops geniculata]
MARSGSGSRASPCDLDREFAPQIAQLLAVPSPQSAQEYYEELIQSKKHDGIRVNYKGDHGKGVCANKDFAEGDLILKDQILVGAQHSLNKIDCVVCSYCFRFIGSVEFQIGHRLYFQSIASSIGCSSERHCHGSDVGSSTCSSGVTKGKEYCFARRGHRITYNWRRVTAFLRPLPFTRNYCLSRMRGRTLLQPIMCRF